jgi:hypothetical protein
MNVRQPKYSMEEHAHRGMELYEKIRPQVEEGTLGKIIAIDIDTGEYEIDPKPMTASDRLRARLPDAQIWLERIGYPAVYAWGTRLLPNQS